MKYSTGVPPSAWIHEFFSTHPVSSVIMSGSDNCCPLSAHAQWHSAHSWSGGWPRSFSFFSWDDTKQKLHLRWGGRASATLPFPRPCSALLACIDAPRFPLSTLIWVLVPCESPVSLKASIETRGIGEKVCAPGFYLTFDYCLFVLNEKNYCFTVNSSTR